MSVKVKKEKYNSNLTYGVVVSSFNEPVTQRLLFGCLKEFARVGVGGRNVKVLWVPGAFEIPVTALKLARRRNISAVVCLGAVIRGETLHFDLIAHQAASGIMAVSLKTGKPVIFGVLTTDTIDQANKRSSEKGENKGADAAAAAVEMTKVLGSI